MARGSVEVRRAGPGDLGLLEALALASTSSRAEVPAQRAPRDPATAPGRLEALLAHPDVEVHVALVSRGSAQERAEVGAEAAVGVAVVRRAELVVPVLARVLHVDQLWVDPAWRRQGVGHLLLAAVAAAAEAAGVEEVSASSEPGQRDAQRFLARLGFGRPVVVRAAPLAVLRSRLGATTAGGRGRRRAALDQVVALRRRQRARPDPAAAQVVAREAAPSSAAGLSGAPGLSGVARPAAGT